MRPARRADAPPVAPLERVPDLVAGRRPLRVLGAGRRASVVLAVDEEGGAAAVKVFADPLGDERVAAELSALAAVRSPHVVDLLDCSAAAGETVCAALERLEGGSLAELLRHRSLRTAEAVTVAVGVARGLAALHDAGWEHARLTPSRILFDRGGRPVLIGLTGCRPHDVVSRAVSASTPAPRPRRRRGAADDASAAAPADDVRFVELVARLLGDDRVDLDALGAAASQDRWDDVEDALFALTPAGPVRLLDGASEGDAGPISPSASQRASPFADGGGGGEERPACARSLLARLARFAEDHVDEAPGALAATRLRAVAARHRRAVVVGGIVAAVLATLVVLLPVGVPRTDAAAGGPSGRGSEHVPSSRSTPTATDAASRRPGSSGEESSRRSGAPSHRAAPSGSGSPRAADPVPSASDARSADEGSGDTAALDAVTVLLARRAECLTSSDRARCLADVDLAGSPIASEDDNADADAGTDPPPAALDDAPDPSPATLSIASRLGDAVLVDVASPRSGGVRSVLVVFTADGWRLRDVF